MVSVTVDYQGFNGLSPETAVKYLTKALATAKKIQKNAKKLNAAIAQPVEHLLGKQEVTGSNPVRSSKKSKKKAKPVKKWLEPMFDRT